jgi:ABC-type transport system involved in multi-copper enzyme maturation permease subunit
MKKSKPAQLKVALPSARRVVPAIAKVTMQEILRDRVLYNVGLFGFLLIGVAFLAARLSFIRPDRILIDFGMAGLNLSLTLMAILLGAQAILREQERHTIWVALSHPIRRGHFITGKFGGVAAVLGLSWLLSSIVLLAALSTQVNQWIEIWRSTLILGLFLVLLQSWFFVALSFFLSSFMTFSMTTMVGIGVFLIGNSLGQLRALADQTKGEPIEAILRVFTALHPDLERFNLGFKMTYNFSVGGTAVLVSVLYAACWIGACLSLSTALLQRSEK